MSGDNASGALLGALVLLSSITFASVAQEIPAETYARFAEANEVLLSPDGSKIAVWSNYVSDMGKAVQINVIDRATNQTSAATTREIDYYELQHVFWLDEENLLLQYFHPDNYFYRNEIVSIEGGSIREIDFGPIVDILPDDPNSVLTTLGENDRGLYRIGTFERAIDQINEEWETYWITDANHEVRLRINFEDDIEVDYIPAGESRYDRIAKYDALDDAYLWPLGFSADPEVFYAYRQHQGKRSLFQVNMASGEPQSQLLVHDPARHLQGDLLKDDGTGAAIGYNFQSDRPTALWSGTWANLMTQLTSALPGNRLRLTQANSETGDYVVLATASDNPGTWLLGNIKTGSLQPFLPRNPALDDQPAVQVSTQWIPGENGETVEALLYLQAGQAAESLPLVVMAGLSSGFEDDQAFDPMAQMLASHGAAVLAVDISGLNTRDVNMLDAVFPDWHSIERIFAGTPEQWVPAMNSRLQSAVTWADRQGLSDGGQVCLLGTEFGANAALMVANQMGDQIACTAAIAPYVKLSDLILELRYMVLENFLEYNPDPRYTLAELREKDHYLAGHYWDRMRRFFTERNAMLNDMSPLENYQNIEAALLLAHDSSSPEIYRGGGEIELYLEKLEDANKAFEYLDYKNLYIQGYSLTAREAIFSAVDTFMKENLNL